jgi:hypothetical protein
MNAHSDIFAGIDPGKTGALAILYGDNTVEFFDVPRVTLRGKDVPAYAEWQTNWSTAMALAGVDNVLIEDVGSRPGQGVSSMFKFGRYARVCPCDRSRHPTTAGRQIHDAGTVERQARVAQFEQGRQP